MGKTGREKKLKYSETLEKDMSENYAKKKQKRKGTKKKIS